MQLPPGARRHGANGLCIEGVARSAAWAFYNP